MNWIDFFSNFFSVDVAFYDFLFFYFVDLNMRNFFFNMSSQAKDSVPSFI